MNPAGSGRTTTSPGGGNCETGGGIRGGDGEDRKKEKRCKEERKVAEEKKIAEEQRKKQEELAEARKEEEKKRQAEERLAEEAAAEAEEERERASAFAKLVEENKKEKERATEDLEKQRKHTAKSHRGVDVEIPAVISDDSDEEGEGKGKESAPRGVQRKRTIKMIAKGDNTSVPDGESDPIPGQVENSEPLQPHSACTRCVMIGRPLESSMMQLVRGQRHSARRKDRREEVRGTGDSGTTGHDRGSEQGLARRRLLLPRSARMNAASNGDKGEER
ncbi:hypothetical protein GGU11DRAFT_812681 [Lentinula aff. detonsa]|nr:hypothetical protein GGU11DRAFT_812681 [Lentinula aff. detonsa]